MQTIRTFEEFRRALSEPLAARVDGEVFPFRAPEPPLEEVIAQARDEPQARICTGTRGAALNEGLADYADAFRSLPLAEAVQAPVHLSLFDLGRLRRRGGALHEVIERIYLPLTRLWAKHGLRWQRVYPILFLSGPHCSTNYHWDPSSVLVVQLSGCKRFYSLKDPRRWVTPDMASAPREKMVRPAELREEDALMFELRPGDAIWSPCATPHWVDADERPAFTLSVAFTDIACEQSPARVMAVA